MAAIFMHDTAAKSPRKATRAQRPNKNGVMHLHARGLVLVVLVVGFLSVEHPVFASQEDLRFVDITRSLGEGFGELKDVFVDDSTVYLAGGSLFRSRNGGTSWDRLPIGGNFENIAIKCVCAKANLICAVTYRGLAISSDSGKSWIDGGLGDDNIDSVCIDEESIFAGSSKGLLRSKDKGQSWRVVAPRLRQVSVDSSTHLMCAVSDNTRYGGLHVSSDGGNTWTEVKQAAPTFEITDVAVGGGVIYVATSRHGLYGSADAGKTWVSFSAEGSKGWPYVTSVSVSGGVIYAGTGSGSLGGGLKASADGGKTWRTYDLRDGLDWRAERVAASGRLVFVANAKALYVSTDAPRRWAAVRIDHEPMNAFVPGEVMYATTSNAEDLMRSSDQGQTWTLACSNHVFGDGANVSDIDADGPRVYLASSSGVAFSEDGGRLWNYRSTAHGLGDNRVSSIIVKGKSVFATTSGGLSISYDGGNTWTNHPLKCKMGSRAADRVVANGKKVYASLAGSCLHVSVDEGRTWTNRSVTCGSGRKEPEVVDFCIRERSIIACVECGGIKMRISDDDGATWRDFGNGVPSDVQHVHCIAILSNKVYLGLMDGVLVSNDDGKTWTKEGRDAGLPAFLSITGLKVFAGKVYATSSSGGTFVSSPK